MYLMAPLLIGTNLSLFPFPVTFIIDSLKYKSETFNVISSETLRPQLYKISIIALFLILFFDFISMLSISLSISFTVNVVGSLDPILGVSIFCNGFSFKIFSKIRKSKNLFMPEIILA